jgi:profilin
LINFNFHIITPRVKNTNKHTHTKKIIMSWDGYVNSLVGPSVGAAAYLGHDGAIWAKSAHLKLSPDEGKKFADAFKNPDGARGTGLTIGGEKFMVIQATAEHVIGKKGTSGFSAYKTNQTIVLGVYNEPQVPGNCEEAVFKSANYLKQNNY